MNFDKIGNANLAALCNNRLQDIIDKKQNILDSLSTFHNLQPTSILFVGFSSFILTDIHADISVTCVDDQVLEFLKSKNIKFTYIPQSELSSYRKQFQVVIAVDEFFTFAETDIDQKNIVAQICNLATDYVITTLRDYKNQDYKDREFSQPTFSKNSDKSSVFLEAHNWDLRDRNSWTSTLYEIHQESQQLTVHGVFARRTMYFKQLAKFSSDSGASDFLVHKNLMYKSLTKKNYEHVITIKFE